MAESDLVEGLIGGDFDLEGTPDLASPGAAEGATAAPAPGEAARSPEVAQATLKLLRRQAAAADAQRRLLEIQGEHLHEQRDLILGHLRTRRWRDKLQLGLLLLSAAVALLVGAGLVLLMAGAVASRSVVVDAFGTPSALAARGLGGQVAAAGVLDRLNDLQTATRALDPGLTARSAWSSDIRIQVPETGVSLGELERLLRDRFGHDLHIGGDLVQKADGGLALTVRGDQIAARTFSGGPDGFDSLAASAAEYIYGQAQPVRYGQFLMDAHRGADALAFLPAAIARAPAAAEQAALLETWSEAASFAGDNPMAVRKARSAMALAAPGSRAWWSSWSQLVNSAPDEESMWRRAAAFLAARRDALMRHRPGPPPGMVGAMLSNTRDQVGALDALKADATSNGGAGSIFVAAGPLFADTYGLMHDDGEAQAYIETADPADRYAKVEGLLVTAYAALDRGDPGAAVAPLQAFWAMWRADKAVQTAWPDYVCVLPHALALVGRFSEAASSAGQMPPYSQCAAARGEALALSGDLTGARQVWARSLRTTPSPPWVYMARGNIEAAGGEYQAAKADLAAASARAPRFADPLKAWGDLLARQGRWRQALVKYDDAMKYAPAWTQLHEARRIAAKGLR